MQALEELDYLAALDNDGNLSEMGVIMSEFSLEPQMAKTVLASCEFDCVSEVVIIAAMLSGNVTVWLFSTNISTKSHVDLQNRALLFFWILLAPSCFMVPSVELKPEATQCYMKFQHPEGDHFTLINIYKAFKQCQQDPCE